MPHLGPCTAWSCCSSSSASSLQSPGRTTFDTKLDLVVDPARLLGSALHLWNPDTSFGELQNQAYGYLFPQGAFFLLGDLADVPPWVTQRLWSALVLVLAYEGTRRLARALAPSWSAVAADRRRPRLRPRAADPRPRRHPQRRGPAGRGPAVGGAAAGPRRLRTVEHRPRGAALRRRLPLRGRGQRHGGRRRPAPAVLLIVAAGPAGAPAAAGPRVGGGDPRGVALVGRCPLLVLGRYSPAFLDVIETSRGHDATLGWTNVLRRPGPLAASRASSTGGPWWQGPYELATAPWLVALTTVVAGAVAARAGPPQDAGPRSRSSGRRCSAMRPARGRPRVAARQPARRAGAGAARRAARAAAQRPQGRPGGAPAAGPRVRPPRRARRARGPAAAGVRRWAARSAVLAAVVALVASSGPLLTGVDPQPGWTAVPRSGGRRRPTSGEGPDAGRTWVVPGSGFGRQTWGWTIDEPIQPLAEAPWVTRSQVPLVPPGTMRYLDALESRITDGRGSPGLADALARAGIATVLVRHDLDVSPTSSVPAGRAVQALENSPGLRPGPDVHGRRRGAARRLPRRAPRGPRVRHRRGRRRARRRWPGGGRRPPRRGRSVPPAGATALVPSTEADPDVLTDTPQRRERQFGRTLDAVGPLLTQDEEFRTQRRVHDFAGAARGRARHGPLERVGPP